MISPLSGIQRQVVISVCLYLGQALCGYTTAWSGPVLPKLRDLEQSPLPYLLTESQLSLIATIIYLGGMLGPYITIWLSNSRGRKPCLICGGVLFALTNVILALSRSLTMLLVGRFVAGAATGTTIVMNLVYIGEIASTNIRGILLTTIGIFTTVGSIVTFSYAPFVSYYATTYLPLTLSLVYIFCLFWIPETPIFCMLQGKDEEVTKVLTYLDRLGDKAELLQMKKELSETNTKKEWIDLFRDKSNRKALFIVAVINILQHSSGVLAVIFFSASIFDMAGSSIDSNVSMIIISFFQLSGSTVTPIFIERIGRKRILAMSCALCSLSMFVLGLYFYLDHIGNSSVLYVKWLPLVILILFYIGYDSGLGIIPNAIIGEMFTSNVRSKGSTVAITTALVFGFLTNTAFGALLEIVGGHVLFWFFAVTCAGAALFTVFFIPETKGKSLLEIQESLP